MQRVVFLVDMNAFFISCEMKRNPSLIGLPAAVAGDPKKRTGIILAANYEARKKGVKTAMVLHEALKLCPDMILVPPDHEYYVETSKAVMELLSQSSPIVEQNSIDEAWLEMTGCEALFGEPLESAQRIMDRIKNELGLWCSIGISENKFLSKMASEMKKPLGITELWQKDLPNKLWPMPVLHMYGIGRQTADKLHALGIDTIGDLAKFNKDYLFRKLGKYGAEIHDRANGIDDCQVLPHAHDEMKSIGRSITLSQDITDIEEAKIILMQLSEEVGMTARKFLKKGRVIHITIKYNDFQTITRQTTVEATYLTTTISSTAIALLSKHWNSLRPVRLLGISLSGFDSDLMMDQISIFQLENGNNKNDKEEKLEIAMDKIRQKHGFTKINRALLMDKHIK